MVLGVGYLGGRISGGRVYPPRTTKAGGTHPTGMLPCLYKFSCSDHFLVFRFLVRLSHRLSYKLQLHDVF